jgi:tRNA(adenine34) deaminase
MGLEEDIRFMQIAFEEARLAYSRGDVPVGAALRIDGRLIGMDGNTTRTLQEWSSHAEALVIKKYASAIQRAKKQEQYVELYTTLDPCLQCMGAIVLNRIDRVIYGCIDPNAGMAEFDPKQLKPWYSGHWPKLTGGVMRDESYALLTQYMQEREKDWGKILKLFEEMRKKW